MTAQTCASCDFCVRQSDGYYLCHWNVQDIQVALADGSLPIELVEWWEALVVRTTGFHPDGLPKYGSPPCPMWRETGSQE